MSRTARRTSPWQSLLAAQVLLVGVQLAAQAPVLAGEASCRTCHPGAVRGLAATMHARLLSAPNACAACHGDLSAHAQASAAPIPATTLPVAHVASAACATCHPGRELAVERAAHPLVGRRSLPAMADTATLRGLDAAASSPAVDWSGLVDFGHRMVHVGGSRSGYATDRDLQPGARLRTAELRGRGRGDAPVDDLQIAAHDIGDPRLGIDGSVQAGGLGSLRAAFRRDRLRYDASGDWHRVDRSARSGSADLMVELGAAMHAFAAFAHADEEGFWLTERVGNRNVSVQSFVTGVASPRRARREDLEVGVTGRGAVWTWTFAASHREDHAVDSWSYSRPAAANPTFPESEDFTSRSSLRGPGGRIQLRGDFDGVTIDVAVRHYDRQRRSLGSGTAAGFDLAQFTTDTTARATGSARSWIADCGIEVDVTADLQLVLDARFCDHREDLSLRQSDVTTFPTLSTTVTASTDVDQHTAQRSIDGEAALRWAATAELDLGLGYGHVEERLRVPEVDASDPGNFRRGTARDRGVLADATWRPAGGWTVRGGWRAFGQDGALLHELAPAEAREETGSIGFAGATGRATAFVRHRRNENDVAQHRLDSLATGCTAGLQGRDLGLDLGYTFARVDAATLTSFYFDPDPNPVPTLVGFHGDTNTLSAALHAAPSGDVLWELTAAWTATKGDFDVATLDWRADVRWQVAGRDGAIGTEYRHSHYRADGGLDDWNAQSLFVYWRQVF